MSLYGVVKTLIPVVTYGIGIYSTSQIGGVENRWFFILGFSAPCFAIGFMFTLFMDKENSVWDKIFNCMFETLTFKSLDRYVESMEELKDSMLSLKKSTEGLTDATKSLKDVTKSISESLKELNKVYSKLL